MAKKIRLGIIGLSEGNGHPYSWSAIFNGYNKEVMGGCPFPVIPDYLSRQKFPQDGLGHLGNVTHIWTQEKAISQHVAKASNIEHVVDKIEDMIGEVDAVLLARDDGSNHYSMALPFLKAGLSIFIDKPLATTLEDARNILASQTYKDQVFSCSSLRYANELILSEEELKELGEIQHVEGSIMKKWDTYAVHLIEPLISQLPQRGKLKQVKSLYRNEFHTVAVEWENLTGSFKTTGDVPTKAEFRFYGSKSNTTKFFSDSFSCFKASLEKFVNVMQKTSPNIDRTETLEIVEIIERGGLSHAQFTENR